MLVDSISLADSSEVKRTMLDQSKRGTAFPGNPVDGQVFELTAEHNGYGPGIYVYFQSEGRFIVKYPNNDVMPYDVSGATFGPMNDGDIVARHISVRSYRIKAGFEACVAAAKIAAVANTELAIKRVSRSGAETEIGKLIFEAAETVGVFTQTGSGDIIVTAGETLVLQAPIPADGSLSDIAFTFAGTLI